MSFSLSKIQKIICTIDFLEPPPIGVDYHAATFMNCHDLANYIPVDYYYCCPGIAWPRRETAFVLECFELALKPLEDQENFENGSSRRYEPLKFRYERLKEIRFWKLLERISNLAAILTGEIPVPK